MKVIGDLNIKTGIPILDNPEEKCDDCPICNWKKEDCLSCQKDFMFDEIIGIQTYKYRGIEYSISKFIYDSSLYKHGFSLESKDPSLNTISHFYMLFQMGELDLLWEDAQHSENKEQTEEERLEYLHTKAKNAIDKIYEIYNTMDSVVDEHIAYLRQKANEFKTLMKILSDVENGIK